MEGLKLVDIIFIGAGPYGISLAAHAKASGLSYVILGRPMHFWQNQMPQNMFIRTNPLFISFSDKDDFLTIERFAKETGTPLVSPFPRPHFVEYAFWFARQTGIEFTPELAVRLDCSDAAFTVTTDSGTRCTGAHVIVATGLSHFSYMPEVFSGLPSSLLTHTYGQTNFDRFKGKQVAVIGSGQSAWEAAALLHMAGSEAELLFRREAVHYANEDNVASGLKLIESTEQFYLLPHEEKLKQWNAPRHGSVAPFLKPFVEGKVKMTGGVTVEQAEAVPGKAKLTLSDGTIRMVDHVISATGYRVDLDLLPFLPPSLLARIQREEAPFQRFPLLNEHFESSVPGLFFTGPLASHTHGRAFGFVAGLRHACRSIIPYVKEKGQSKEKGA
ncbi:NADPH-dependent L-lysine 6-monooxygenase [Paenibacillus sp. 32O-W]|uniref:NAD(P)-binding domain-containing protein n=1 Tax=Paenibacillus sp. 32O-W TaxID=1695218 RepID=UPI000721E893|nr:NAD(P)-binding domain-containing protein [Paenibacillus sp. 32O-W]ALS29124.1 NADPH-dependent L-lysine 6-monooxygenase [Paenibacillus sp. 32O-W]